MGEEVHWAQRSFLTSPIPHLAHPPGAKPSIMATATGFPHGVGRPFGHFKKQLFLPTVLTSFSWLVVSIPLSIHLSTS